MSVVTGVPPARRRSPASPHSSASPAPLIMGAVSVFLSVVLVAVTLAVSSPASILGLSLAMVPSANWSLSLAGYVLTPMLVTIALGWDRIAQRRGLQYRNFVLKPKYGLWLRILVAIGFVISLWHILNLAYIVAGALTQVWGLG